MPARTAASAATLAAIATILAAAPADARQARCYNTDDGFYACEFTAFGGDGSFSISAPTKPTYTISMVGRGVADGFANYGNRNIPLPGTFYRDSGDRACWVSDATQFTVCAY
jgi:hypothetical protein